MFELSAILGIAGGVWCLAMLIIYIIKIVNGE